MLNNPLSAVPVFEEAVQHANLSRYLVWLNMRNIIFINSNCKALLACHHKTAVLQQFKLIYIARVYALFFIYQKRCKVVRKRSEHLYAHRCSHKHVSAFVYTHTAHKVILYRIWISGYLLVCYEARAVVTG